MIYWLRPLADPWSVIDPNTSKWQYRRVQRAVAEGIVLRGATVSEIGQGFEKDGEAYEGLNVEQDAGAVALLFPPRGRCRWSLGSILLLWKLWFLDILRPVYERGANEKVRATV